MLRLARWTDKNDLFNFFTLNESRIIPIIERVYTNLQQARPNLKNLYIWKPESKIEGLISLSDYGLVSPFFLNSSDAERASINLFGGENNVFAIVGLADSVLPFIGRIGEPQIHWKYTHLVFQPQLHIPSSSQRNFSNVKPFRSENIEYRLANLQDLDNLLDLEEAYQHEEVLTPGMVYIREAGRFSLEKQINEKKLLVASCFEKLIGKACINAVSFNYCQIGGVYTEPMWRNKGISTNLMNLIRMSMLEKNLGMSLFVRRENASALRVYARTGFSQNRDFSIAYYQE